MEKANITWRIFGVYLLVLFFILISGNAFSQIQVAQFNAGWNKANEVAWINKLTDCGIKRINIDKGDWQKEFSIIVVPTIIVFNGEEVKRFQADLSFKLLATKEEVQEIIDEILMSDF